MARSLHLLACAAILTGASACDTASDKDTANGEDVYVVLPLDPPSGPVDGLTAPGDLDGDGADDLVVTTSDDDALRWFGGGFERTAAGEVALDYPGPPFSPGDLDGDGYPDVVVAGQRMPVHLLVYAGGPDGLSAAPLVVIETEQNPNALHIEDVRRVAAAGDVDGDGTPEIAVADPQGVWVYEGIGPSWESRVWCDGCSRFGETVAGPGDMDADGYDDVVAQTPNGFLLLHGAPEGLQVRSYVYYTQVEDDAACWASGDVDGDGFADVACVDGYPDSPPRGERSLVLAYGASTGASEPEEWLTVPEDVERPAMLAPAGDADLDGIADLLVGWPGADHEKGGVLLYAGAEGGPSSRAITSFPGKEIGVRLGSAVVGDLDLDDDGWSDMAAVATDPATGIEEVRVYFAADRGR